MAVNHVVGTGVTAISAILLSKALGPGDFAIYALCTSLASVLRIASRLGINASLLSQREEPAEKDYQTALSITSASSVIVAVVALCALRGLGHFSHVPNLFWPGAATAALVPLHMLALPATTRMERRLQFFPITVIELASQVVSQAVGISLAFNGWHIWGPVSGWCIRAVVVCVAPWIYLGITPRFGLHLPAAARMLRFGFGYSVTASVEQSRSLILLASVGRLIGPDAVGLMGLTLRAAGLVAPVRAAVSRVILPALAPIADNRRALRRWLNAAVETEVAISIPVAVAAIAVYGPCVRVALGPFWQATVPLFPWVVGAALLASAHAAALSALHVRGFFAESVAASCVGHAAVLAGIATLSGLAGLEGCAAAMMLAWPASWLQDWFSARRLGSRWSRNGVAWAMGGAAACLAWRVGPVALIVPTVVLLMTWPAIRLRFGKVFAALSSRPGTAGASIS